jgi:hypothetical protein
MFSPIGRGCPIFAAADPENRAQADPIHRTAARLSLGADRWLMREQVS